MEQDGDADEKHSLEDSRVTHLGNDGGLDRQVATENRGNWMDWWHRRKGDSGTMRKNDPSVWGKGIGLVKVLSSTWQVGDPRGDAGTGDKA